MQKECIILTIPMNLNKLVCLKHCLLINTQLNQHLHQLSNFKNHALPCKLKDNNKMDNSLWEVWITVEMYDGGERA